MIVTFTCRLCDCKLYNNGLCRRHYDHSVGIVAWDKKYPEKQRARVRKYRAEHPDAVKAMNRAGHQRNKDKRNAYDRTYREAHKDHMNELSRTWSKNNPQKWKIYNSTRRATKFNAIFCPPDTEWEQLALKEFYDLAIRRTKVTGTPWHVDHIVPLNSKLVCGLHWSANLQVIPGVENHRKGNRVWPNMP